MNNLSKNRKFPFDIVNVDKIFRENLTKDSLAERDQFIQIEPKKYFFPLKFQKFAEEMYDFETRTSDVWTVSFPRSGCTWTQEMIWLIENNLDYESAQAQSSTKNLERFIFFEQTIVTDDNITAELSNRIKDNPDQLKLLKELTSSPFNQLNEMKNQRFIKTHVPLSLLPPSLFKSGAKIIYIARNPKDVVVSNFYLAQTAKFLEFQGNFEQFCNNFMNNEVLSSPYWAHVKEGWKQRNNPNVLFIFYEEMKKDLPKCIQKVAEFLDKSITNKEIGQLCEYLQFDNLSKIPIANKEISYKLGLFKPTNQTFIRQGKSSSNDWPKEYTPEMIKKFEQWMKDNMADTDLQFPEV